MRAKMDHFPHAACDFSQRILLCKKKCWQQVRQSRNIAFGTIDADQSVRYRSQELPSVMIDGNRVWYPRRIRHQQCVKSLELSS